MTSQEARIYLACFGEELREVQSKIATLLDKVDDDFLIQEAGAAELQIGHSATIIENLSRPSSQQFTLIRQIRESLEQKRCREVGKES